MTQPEALRLADHLEREYYVPAAAELRRLYAVNQELLEALQLIADVGDRAATEISRAAIAKVEGKI